MSTWLLLIFQFTPLYRRNRNFDQLKRIVTQLCATSSASYISTAEVMKVLNREKELYENTTSDYPSMEITIDNLLKKSLFEIDKAVILKILEANNNNKSATASQLGISRSTLWRYLNSEKK